MHFFPHKVEVDDLFLLVAFNRRSKLLKLLIQAPNLTDTAKMF